ncbi:sensor histidine kinase [Paenibacillus sp. CAU 1782]
MSWLKNMNLRDKMLANYFFCVFVPILLMNVIFFNIITTNVREQRILDISRAVEQVGNDFRLWIDDAVNLSSFFYADFRTNEILEREYAYPEEYVETYDNYLRQLLNSYNPGSVSFKNITIYSDNKTLLHSGNIGYLSNEIRAKHWYQAAIGQSRSGPLFIRIAEGNGDESDFSLLRRLDYFPDRMNKEKLLKIDLKTRDLDEILGNLNVPGDIYLVDPEGFLQYGISREPGHDGSQRIRFDAIESSQQIQFESVFDDIRYLRGWKIVAMVDRAEIASEVWESRDFILWSAGLMLTVPTLIILLMSRSINRRIIRILKHMKKVKSQNFEIIQDSDSRDEIGQLTLEFNRMTQQIKSLIQDVYMADIQKKSLELERRQAQLNALQSQVNPHFLFNALETIRMRSLLKQEEETAHIIHSMAKIFRSSLTWSKDRITVDEELVFIRCFLDIQKYRFEDKLDYNIDVSPEAQRCLLPKMIFLPFVENACIHGIEPMKQGGRIDISIEEDHGALIFEIRDNGIGMADEKVAELRHYLISDEIMGERIGIQNVVYRSKLIYGDGFAFDIQSSPGHGTFVRLSIPFEQ